jgi:hypothetical protein
MGWVLIGNIRGTQGPQGVQGPPGSTYIHNQTSASASWNVNHNLGQFPNIAVVMDDGTVVAADVDHTDTNSAVITFPSPYTGKAVCS